VGVVEILWLSCFCKYSSWKLECFTSLCGIMQQQSGGTACMHSRSSAPHINHQHRLGFITTCNRSNRSTSTAQLDVKLTGRSTNSWIWDGRIFTLVLLLLLLLLLLVVQVLVRRVGGLQSLHYSGDISTSTDPAAPTSSFGSGTPRQQQQQQQPQTRQVSSGDWQQQQQSTRAAWYGAD